ncbi:MAG: hypothetical protein JKY14_09855 [Paraglaciecola sp.]|nr:hypothetical protein [Paraglaciecola sp.]
MARKILCLFEGIKRELNYFDSLLEALPNTDKSAHILCSYGNDLYELYKVVEKDRDLDVVELLRDGEGGINNSRLLMGVERDQVTDIYMFFDMECQDDQYSDKKLLEMINTFDDENEKGKLIISYPMIEAIRHVENTETFNCLKVSVEQCKGKIYKQLSAQKSLRHLQNPKTIQLEHWQELIRLNLAKANYIVNGSREISLPPEQLEIAKAQIAQKSQDDHIYVLAAYPLFAADYYGLDTLSFKTTEQS